LEDHNDYNKSNFNKVTKPQMYRVYKKLIMAGKSTPFDLILYPFGSTKGP